MNRSLYDRDIATFSPEGDLHQVDYACQCSKQYGSATIGIKTKTHLILCALKKDIGSLAHSHQKIFKLNTHTACVGLGLTSDVRLLTNFLKSECRSHNYVYSEHIPTKKLIYSLASKVHSNTISAGNRPYGASILLGGVDFTGPHLYCVSASGDFYEYYAHAVGSRTEASRTYLNAHLEVFEDANVNDLIQHAIVALEKSLPHDTQLKSDQIDLILCDKEGIVQYTPEQIDNFIERDDNNDE
eukprot:TRINITY_DN3083_c0_g1_i1.p1 TRINITY_DN3083_c0_g1~~TRINITY_DN3083_c0_g1_i1.p1  ORF type:complete len:259 (-),score=63.21 TRINITY_DN3083_c0_g1_i1:728-1453(-)